MDAIGDELMVSRSSVSRLLQMVRDRSIIMVKIHSPEDATRRMIIEIKKRHGLNTHLIPVPESASPIERLNRVALTAARMLTNFFFAGMTMDVAQGSAASGY
jgi:DNA-binding transcriptional regulator LsrR (DeoR family)